MEKALGTEFEFTSAAFPPYDDRVDAVQPGLYGRRLAEFLQRELEARGFRVRCLLAEDWGWVVELHNEAFPLWIGCASDMETPNAFRCFIEPSRSYVWRRWRRVPTAPAVAPVAEAVAAILADSVENLRRFCG